FVTDNVLALQFERDLLAGLFKIVDRCAVRMTTGHFGEFADQSPSHVDDIDLCVGFAKELVNIPTAVTAVIVFAVGDEQQRLSGILSFLELSESEVDRI